MVNMSRSSNISRNRKLYTTVFVDNMYLHLMSGINIKLVKTVKKNKIMYELTSKQPMN